MKNSSLLKIASTACLTFLASGVANAGQLSPDGSKECTDAVRRCFDFAEDARVTCLYETQDLNFCAGSTAKAIVELRLGLGKNAGQAQRNAYMVDGRCVERCDYQFVRTIISGELDQNGASIKNCYEHCKVDERRPMLRP
jgi:hypothetical protein